jgi:hypothetical protein
VPILAIETEIPAKESRGETTIGALTTIVFNGGAMKKLMFAARSQTDPSRRPAARETGHPLFRGIECRADDAHPANALYFVAILFRVMSGLLLLLMVVQVALGLTSTVEISYGVLVGEAIRLVIFAGLLWAAGDLADLVVKSHCDILAARILLAELTSDLSRRQTPSPSVPTTNAPGAGRQDDPVV